ncbi:MAG: hypothetical protein MJ245_02575 [Clostridia bacterium]|nr:hypothetical protein [Clostridia bacterium]
MNNIVMTLIMILFAGFGAIAILLFFVGLVWAIIDKIKEFKEKKKAKAVGEKA